MDQWCRLSPRDVTPCRVRGVTFKGVTDVRDIGEWLAEEGYDTPAAAAVARAELEAAGFTNARKRSMAAGKLERASAYLGSRLVRACSRPECSAAAPRMPLRGRRLVGTLTRAACDVCGGSNNQSAATGLMAAAERAGLTRVLVVGGTPVLHRELAALAPSLSFRFVDGNQGQHTKKGAIGDLQWAEVAVIWANTPLPHRVSTPYKDECPADLPMITVRTRGLEGFCSELTRLLGGREHRRA